MLFFINFVITFVILFVDFIKATIVIYDTFFFFSGYHFILFLIGLLMIILNTFVQRKDISFFTKLKLIWKNIYFLFFLYLFIFSINITILTLGFGITVNTTNVILFVYTIFCRIVLFKIIFIILIYWIKGSVSLEFMCLSIKDLGLIFLFSYFNYYYFMVFVGVIYQNINSMLVGNLKELFKDTIKNGSSLFSSTFNKDVVSSIINILNSCPLLRGLIRCINIWILNTDCNRSSPFRKFEKAFKRINTLVYFTKPMSKFIHFKNYNNYTREYSYTVKLHCKSDTFLNLVAVNYVKLYNHISNLVNSEYIFNIICYDSNLKLEISCNEGRLEKLLFTSDKRKIPYVNLNFTDTNKAYYEQIPLKKNHNELDFLKFNSTPPKDLVNYTVNSALVNFDPDSLQEETELTSDPVIYSNSPNSDVSSSDEGTPFPLDTVTALPNEPYYDYHNLTLEQRETELLDIEDEIYNMFRGFRRTIPYINNGLSFILGDYMDDYLNLLPNRYKEIFTYRCSRSELEYVFDYTYSNNIIYAIINDIKSGVSNLANPNDANDPELDILIRKWMALCGTTWMIENELPIISIEQSSFV